MLQIQSVREPLWNLLKDLQKKDVLNSYFLVGGTALSLQLGHRLSDDIDLFTKSNINKDEILDLLNRDYYGKYQILNMQNIIFQITVNNIKVDFVKYDYNLIENVKTEY